MCGITGFAGFRDDGLLERMIGRLLHRGPDDEGRYSDDFVSLGMRRLSVIDLAGGRQPIWNEDRTVCVIFNGEIYNFEELRDQLVSKGHRFSTRSDTEVLVHLYEEHGEAAVERLRGMFAFALWDQNQNQLLLARDRLGIKPLFYAVGAGRLFFASEIKALRAAGLGTTIDPHSLRKFLSFLYVPSPATIFQGIQRLPPGHILTFARGEARLQRYWSLQPDPSAVRLSGAEAEERLLALLRETVRLHLISDVPLGVFLSGGIDSSALVYAMRAVSDAEIRTFTVGYGPEARSFNELAFARKVADYFGTKHHEEIVRPDALDLLPRMIQAFDEPFADSSAIPNYLICEVARRWVTVALTGIGGDEIFGGYPRYLGQRLGGSYDRLPAWVRRALASASRLVPESTGSDNWPGRIRRFLEAGALTADQRYLRWVTFLPPEWGDSALSPDLAEQLGEADPEESRRSLYRDWHSADPAERAMVLDIRTYLPDDLLTLGDRMSMAHSLELRVPFCDHILVQFAIALSARERFSGWRLKSSMRRALRGSLPKEILSRPKQGFMVPLGQWIKTDLAPIVRELLSEENVRRRGFFNPRYVQWLLQEHESGRRNFTDQIYVLLTLEIWQRVCMEDRSV